MRAKVAQNSTASNSHADGQTVMQDANMVRLLAAHHGRQAGKTPRGMDAIAQNPCTKAYGYAYVRPGPHSPPSYLKCTKRPTARLCMPYDFLVIAAWANGLWSKLASATLQTVQQL